MMNQLFKKWQTALLSLAVLGQQAAWAVNDLPGGPAVRQLNLHPPVTKIAAEQVWLHWFMLIICSVIFVAVFGVMFYSIFKHRKSLGHKPADFHESVKVEIAWTVVPFIIVIIMAVMANTMTMTARERLAEYATLKALGFPQIKQQLKDITAKEGVTIEDAALALVAFLWIRPRELEGEVRFDAFTRGRYATDASIYQIEPVGIVVPRDETDLGLALDGDAGVISDGERQFLVMFCETRFLAAMERDQADGYVFYNQWNYK